MSRHIAEIGGLHCHLVGEVGSSGRVVVLLHGYAMTSTDLAPFGSSLGVPGLFLFPQGPLEVSASGGTGRAWWQIDAKRRATALQEGPRELVNDCPAGLPDAREALSRFMAAVMIRYQPVQVVVGGFSQGGMLACDWLLHGGKAHSLVLMSSSRINIREWQTRRSRLSGLDVFVSHGLGDADLALAAGQGLRDFAVESGACVTWVPFEGGHEIPLTVWRLLRTFLRGKSPLPKGPASKMPRTE